ncbi:MAG TPA: hypothetical protein VJJ51_13690, partial [Candidatus Methanoperedens sp.]|nr:hypothetical protein [Candidatus Methanoperedens sp.]HLB72088.1 hypothetical protein [Candidatus Methanoperedens sp.]
MVDAKKYQVPDIQIASFIIEILDDEQKPVAGAGFSVYVDGVGMSAQTDKDGIIRVPRPKSEVRLALAGEETGSASEESKAPGEEVETSTPLQSPTTASPSPS